MPRSKKNPRAIVKKAQIYAKISRSFQPKKISKEVQKNMGRSTGYGRLA